MATGVRTYFRKPSSTKFLGVTAVDATADSIAVGGRDVKFVCVSGNLWINWVTTATAAATSYKMAVGEELYLGGITTLSIISDGDGATYEYICFE